MTLLSGKVIAAIAAGVIAVGGATAAVLSKKSDKDTSSKKSSTVAELSGVSTNSGSDNNGGSDNFDSENSTSGESTTQSSSNEQKLENEWDINDLSAAMESIKSKSIDDAKQILAEKFGTSVDNWETKNVNTYYGVNTVYTCEIPGGIKVHNVDFDTINFVEQEGTGIVRNDDGGATVTLYKRYWGTSMDYAESSCNYLVSQIPNDELTPIWGQKNTWLTNSGLISIDFDKHISGNYSDIIIAFRGNYVG